jgi:hypothetical protein
VRRPEEAFIEFTISGRYNGPHTSGNGGYSAGALARFVHGPATVRLNAPPPLDTRLTVEDRDDHLVALDGETVVMEARPATGDAGAAPFVPFDEAVASSTGYPGWTYHAADGCFVCGPARSDEYGLRLFPGPVSGEQVVAAGWVPNAASADDAGVVFEEVVWGVIDCPGAWAAAAHDLEGMPYFPTLGTMTAQLEEPVRVGERLVVVGRYRSTEGRKLHTDVVLFGEDGSTKARSRHIEIKLLDYDATR